MEKKKNIIISIIVSILLLGVVASSYAYFATRIQSSGQTSTSVGEKTLDSVSFNVSSDISLVANQDNFAFGKGDLTGSTTATVLFTARNDEVSGVYYDVWFENNNEDAWFEYSTDSSEPEIVLTIKKNGETILEQEDITRSGERYIFSSKKMNYFFYVIKDVDSEEAQLYWCLTDYYPE